MQQKILSPTGENASPIDFKCGMQQTYNDFKCE